MLYHPAHPWWFFILQITGLLVVYIVNCPINLPFKGLISRGRGHAPMTRGTLSILVVPMSADPALRWREQYQGRCAQAGHLRRACQSTVTSLGRSSLPHVSSHLSRHSRSRRLLHCFIHSPPGPRLKCSLNIPSFMHFLCSIESAINPVKYKVTGEFQMKSKLHN